MTRTTYPCSHPPGCGCGCNAPPATCVPANHLSVIGRICYDTRSPVGTIRGASVVRNSDGTVSFYDEITGVVLVNASIVACPGDECKEGFVLGEICYQTATPGVTGRAVTILEANLTVTIRDVITGAVLENPTIIACAGVGGAPSAEYDLIFTPATPLCVDVSGTKTQWYTYLAQTIDNATGTIVGSVRHWQNATTDSLVTPAGIITMGNCTGGGELFQFAMTDFVPLCVDVSGTKTQWYTYVAQTINTTTGLPVLSVRHWTNGTVDVTTIPAGVVTAGFCPGVSGGGGGGGGAPEYDLVYTDATPVYFDNTGTLTQWFTYLAQVIDNVTGLVTGTVRHWTDGISDVTTSPTGTPTAGFIPALLSVAEFDSVYTGPTPVYFNNAGTLTQWFTYLAQIIDNDTGLPTVTVRHWTNGTLDQTTVPPGTATSGYIPVSAAVELDLVHTDSVPIYFDVAGTKTQWYTYLAESVNNATGLVASAIRHWTNGVTDVTTTPAGTATLGLIPVLSNEVDVVPNTATPVCVENSGVRVQWYTYLVQTINNATGAVDASVRHWVSGATDVTTQPAGALTPGTCGEDRVIGEICYEAGVAPVTVRKASVTVRANGSIVYNDSVSGLIVPAPVVIDCASLDKWLHGSMCYTAAGGATRAATIYLSQDGTVSYFDTETGAPLGTPTRVDCPCGCAVAEATPSYVTSRVTFGTNVAVTVAATAVPVAARELDFRNMTAADVLLTLSGAGGGTWNVPAGAEFKIANPAPEVAWTGTYAVSNVQGDSGALRTGSLAPALFFNWKQKI